MKEGLMQKFSRSESYIEGELFFLVPEKPRQEFVTDLKASLLAEMPQKKRTWSSRKAKYSVGIFGSIMATSFVLFGTLLFGVSPQGKASNATLISGLFGQVFVEENHVATPGMSLEEGALLESGPHSGVTVRFFEDSLLRMDENTKLTITKLKTHPIRNDLGEVHVQLESGRIWVRNFSPHDQHSKFIVLAQDHTVTLDIGGAADISFQKQEFMVRVWERMLRIASILDEDERLLSEGEKFATKLTTEKHNNLTPEDSEELWVRFNKQEDTSVQSMFIENKITKDQEYTATGLEKLRSAFISPFSESKDESLQEVEELFFEALSEITKQKDPMNAHWVLFTFEEKLKGLHKNHPEEADAFLVSAEKTLSSILPSSPLFSIQQRISVLRAEYEEQNTLVKEKQRTQRLWQASRLADAGHVALAQAIVAESTNIETYEEETLVEVLDEREKQIAALSTIPQENIIEEAEEILLKNTSALVRPGFPQKTEKDTEEKAHEVIRKVKQYESDIGKKNTLRAHLNKIENNIENVSLVVEIKNRLPEELQEEAQRKILDIVSEEKRKAKQ